MTKSEYISRMHEILTGLCIKHGYNPCVAAGMVAQSIQEGWNSGLATKYHNYWGMKAGSSFKGKTVAMNNKAKTDPAVYRVYETIEDGAEGYFDFLSYPRYQALKSCQTSEEFLKKIGPAGWNPNPGYGDRCIKHLSEVYAVVNVTSSEDNWKGRVTARTGLNIRSSAEKTNSNKLYAIPYGTKVIVFGESNGWYHVHVLGKSDGWCSSKFIASDGAFYGK